MVFGFFKKKAPPPGPQDPIAVFDQVIASVERQGAEVRKSAATLLAMRAALQRDVEKYEQRTVVIEEKLGRADGDARSEKTLRRDLVEAKQLLERSREAHAQADANGRLLMEAAEDLARQLTELHEERQSARVRLKAGLSVSEALKAQVANFDRVMKLEAARDEVEKAHALAELYREDNPDLPLPRGGEGRGEG
jgi:phage shock protein A